MTTFLQLKSIIISMGSSYLENDILNSHNLPETDMESPQHIWLGSKYQIILSSGTTTPHEALHNVREFHYTTTPNFRQAIDFFFQSEYTRHLALTHWKLFVDFEETVEYQDDLQCGSGIPDLASYCASNCAECFYFLLNQRIIEPCYYNIFGQSLFILVLSTGTFWMAEHLISTISPVHLLALSSVSATREASTILQVLSASPELFTLCWGRLEQAPLDLRGAVDSTSLRNICQWMSTTLADRFLTKGISIANAVKSDCSLWMDIIMHHPDPGPILDWLRYKGCIPPSLNCELLLENAIRHDRLAAALWLIFCSNCSQDLRTCVMEAARRQTQASVIIFSEAMRCLSSLDKSNTAAEDIAIEIIFNIHLTPRELSSPSHLLAAEDLAVEKILALASLYNISFDQSVVNYAKSANLQQLATLLHWFEV